jgi:hypothetical protein
MMPRQKRNTSLLNQLIALCVSASLLMASIPWHNHHEEHEHKFHEEHETVLHETDSCHNFIFHGEVSSNCEKHSHATENEITCLICHFHKAPEKLLYPSTAFCFSAFYELQLNLFLGSNHCSTSFYTQPNRGPPHVV